MADSDSGTPPTAGDAEESRLDDLVAQGIDHLEREGEAGFERFLSGHAVASPRIRSRIDALRVGGLLEPVTKPLDLAIPEKLGEFRLVRCLGSGGMGVVYLAEQEGLHRLVALKMLLPAHLFFPHARERFRREVEIVARLNHPGIVPIYMVGEEAGLPYFAMECVDGCSLGELLRSAKGRDPATLTGADLRALIRQLAHGSAAEGGPPKGDDPARAGASGGQGAQQAIDDVFAARVFSGSWTDAALRLLEQVAAALAHAHARGVLHRDVKPSNIMVRADGRAQLVDFGLALLEGSSKITRSGANPGSLPYMSPEQLDASRGEPDVRADVYSLGVTLYETLTLQSAFDSPSREVTTRRILEGDAVPLKTFQPRIPRDVATVCATAMAPEPARRYATAAGFARDLEAVREGRPIAARPPSLAWSAWRRVRRHPVRALAAVAVLLAVATFYVTSLSDRSFTEQAYSYERGRNRAQEATKRVMTAIGSDQKPKPEDLALFETEVEDPKFAGDWGFLKQSPFDAKVWDELEKSVELPNPAAATGITLVQPLAGTTDATPNFIFDVPAATDRVRGWTVVISRNGSSFRTLEVEQRGEEPERLQIEFPEPGLAFGDYTWCVRRNETAARGTADAPLASSIAQFTVVDLATIRPTLDIVDQLRQGDAGLANVARLMSAATYLRYRCAKQALQELADFPPDAPPENHSYRLLLEAHAHAILVDAESLAAKRKEAEELKRAGEALKNRPESRAPKN